MPTPFESGQLILHLFELRRDPVLRQAREWFLREFHPRSLAEVVAVLGGEHNPHYRMVTGYWDMACSLVTHGAIDRQMFIDANPEIFATFAKVHLLVPELREASGFPDYLRHLESVVLSVPGVEARLEALRRQFRSLASASGTGERAPGDGD
jgi:hypothetical protein